jgi:four helix bundle protein
MATISSFEEMEIWQLARKQATELYHIYVQGTLAKDFELKNQINASSGSVMDNIAEVSNVLVIKNFLIFLLLLKALTEKFVLNFSEL